MTSKRKSWAVRLASYWYDLALSARYAAAEGSYAEIAGWPYPYTLAKEKALLHSQAKGK